MTTDHRAEIDTLLANAAALPDGPVKMAITEQAVALADSHGDADLGYTARKGLVSAACFANRHDVALVAFVRVLAHHDATPAPTDGGLVLLYYRWVAGAAADFPTIAKTQIDSLYADLQRRYEAAGTSLQMLWKSRRHTCLVLGDRRGAVFAHAEMNRAQREASSDCAACVQNSLVSYLARLGDDAATLEAARPIFEEGLTCGSVPGATHGHVLLPLLRLGRHTEAARHIKVGYPLLVGKLRTSSEVGRYLIGLTLTDNVRRATCLLDAHFSEAVADASPWERFEFFLAARLLAEGLAKGRAKRVDIRIPDGLVGLSGPRLTVGALTLWLDRELAALAEAFDTRNGNRAYSDRVAGLNDLFQFAKKCPIR